MRPWARLAELQAGNPRELRVVALLPAYGETEERAMHRRFAVDRVRGEWFDWSPDLRALAERYAVAEGLLPAEGTAERALLLQLASRRHPVRASSLEVPYPRRSPYPSHPRLMRSAGVAKLCAALARRDLIVVTEGSPRRYALTAAARERIASNGRGQRGRPRRPEPPSREQMAIDGATLAEAFGG